ncbi:TlpA disulfide reductase family protein [Candidatus Pelagibacter sp.]|nr:TlpA disulfide reductase family protein [Candidatus Pelagibacter sp.]
MRFLIIFIFLIVNSYADESSIFKSIIVNKELKRYDRITFIDDKNKKLNLSDFEGNLVLMNFWATWCEPCKEEMPSLDLLISHKSLNNLKIFPINVGQDSNKKVLKFYEDLEINNLSIYFDTPVTLAKKFRLRGVPTTILFNKKGEEFARIIGSIDFEDPAFIKWLSKFN